MFNLESYFKPWYYCRLNKKSSNIGYDIEYNGPFADAMEADQNRIPGHLYQTRLVYVFPLQPEFMKMFWIKREMRESYLGVKNMYHTNKRYG